MVRKVFLVTLVVFLALNSFALNPKKFIKNSGAPLHITANKLIAFDKKGLYIFSGDVVAVKGEIKLTADKMEVYKNLKTGDIDKVVCVGHVVVTKQDKKATADRAVYIARDSKVTLIGHAVVVSGKNKIISDRIVYYLNKDYVVSQSDNSSERVEVTIYPKTEGRK